MALRVSPIIIIMLLPLMIMNNIKCAGQLTVQNLRKTMINVCTNASASSGPIKLDADETKPLQVAQGSSLILWGQLDSSDCIIDTHKPNAKTVAGFNFGIDDVSYWVSAEIGYNFGIRMRPLQGATACDTISCVGDLKKCPDELKSYENGTAVGCKAPEDCSGNKSAQLCSNYLSTSSCQTSNGSSISSTCSTPSVELLLSFTSD